MKPDVKGMSDEHLINAARYHNTKANWHAVQEDYMRRELDVREQRRHWQRQRRLERKHPVTLPYYYGCGVSMSHLPTYAHLKHPWRHRLAHWLGLYMVFPIHCEPPHDSWIRYVCATCGVVSKPEQPIWPL